MSKKSGIAKLIVGIGVVILFVGFIGPYLNKSSNNPVMLFINKNEMDTGSLFYTECEQGLEAIEKINLKNKK